MKWQPLGSCRLATSLWVFGVGVNVGRGGMIELDGTGKPELAFLNLKSRTQ